MAMGFKTFHQYYGWLVGLIDKTEVMADRSCLTCLPLSRQEGVVRAPKITGFFVAGQPPGLLLKDGSFLRFKEEVCLQDDGSFVLLSYAYHYERPGGYYFRYEKLKEPHPDPAFEPQRHLHVLQDAPRFPTHSTSLEEVMAIIKANFFRAGRA